MRDGKFKGTIGPAPGPAPGPVPGSIPNAGPGPGPGAADGECYQCHTKANLIAKLPNCKADCVLRSCKEHQKGLGDQIADNDSI